MRDYSQILRQKSQNSGGNGQSQRQNSGQRSRQSSEQMRGSGSESLQNSGNLTKRVATPVANTLGMSAETARQVGIPKKQAHQIVNSAYRGGGSGRQQQF